MQHTLIGHTHDNFNAIAGTFFLGARKNDVGIVRGLRVEFKLEGRDISGTAVWTVTLTGSISSYTTDRNTDACGC